MPREIEKNKPKHPGGRPTLLNEKLMKEICDEISVNATGLENLCRENPHWPNVRTIQRWIAKDEEFCRGYARAKVTQTELMVDSMYSLINNSEPENYGKTRLLIDTIKWKACKLVPKIYGDRSYVESKIEVKHADALDELE